MRGVPTRDDLRDHQGRTLAEYVTDQITEAIARSKMSIAAVAELSGINHETLRRRINGDTPFTINEVGRLASALDLSLIELTRPSGFVPV